MFQSSQRPAQGRKAVRTSTAPSLFSDSDKNSLQSESCMKDALDSRTADCRSPTFDLRGDSNHISRKLGVENIRRMRDRSLPSPVSREEVQSIYSVHQHLKNTIIQFKDPAKQGCCPSPTRVKRRKEVIRCWSRERIIRNETIISIRPPTSPKPALEHKNESNEENLHKSRLTASTSNFRTFPSEMSANQSESSVSLPSSLRYIPVQIIDDNQANNTKTTVSSSISDKCQQNNLPDKTSWIKSSNKDISNKRLNLSISNLEYAEYKDDE
ncbi:unnamed protein product [Trichobilharzia regenti]|nr:unnamed protein product [Trichobilharzia regenti]